MPNISWWEILLLALVVLLIFGPKRLPQIGRSMGRGFREFKDTVTDQSKELKEAVGTTPKEFKDGLNPFKSEPEQEEAPAPAVDEREVVVTTQEDVAPAPSNGSDPGRTGPAATS